MLQQFAEQECGGGWESQRCRTRGADALPAAVCFRGGFLKGVGLLKHFAWHILPRDFVRVRHFGFLSARRHSRPSSFSLLSSTRAIFCSFSSHPFRRQRSSASSSPPAPRRPYLRRVPLRGRRQSGFEQIHRCFELPGDRFAVTRKGERLSNHGVTHKGHEEGFPARQ